MTYDDRAVSAALFFIPVTPCSVYAPRDVVFL